MEGIEGSAETTPPDPGARWALGRGWGTMKTHFWTFLWMVLAYFVVAGVGVGARVGIGMATSQVAGLVVQFLWSLVVVTPLAAGLAYAYLEGVRGTEPGTDELLAGFQHVVPLVAASILVGIAVSIGFILLILPGIYLGVRLIFTMLLVVDRDMGALEAMKASWGHTSGEVLDLFLLGLASVVILVGGTLLLVVGLVPASIWVGAALASYYHAVVDGGEPVGSGAGDEPTRVPEPGAAEAT